MIKKIQIHLAITMLQPDMFCFENSVDPDQLAEAS